MFSGRTRRLSKTQQAVLIGFRSHSLRGNETETHNKTPNGPEWTRSETHLCSELSHTWSPRPHMSTVPRCGGGSDPRTLLCHKSAGVRFRSTGLKRHDTTQTQKEPPTHERRGAVQRSNGALNCRHLESGVNRKEVVFLMFDRVDVSNGPFRPLS